MSDYGRRGFHEGGGNVWNTLKAGGTEKSVEKTKILKRSGQAGSSVGCLKKKKARGTGTSLRTKSDLP